MSPGYPVAVSRFRFQSSPHGDHESWFRIGTLEVTTARLLTKTLGFGERTADDVMTPRVRCAGIHRDESADDVLRLSRRTGHSRFPVLGNDWDDIDGVVHVKRAMAVPHERRKDVPVSATPREQLLPIISDLIARTDWMASFSNDVRKCVDRELDRLEQLQKPRSALGD